MTSSLSPNRLHRHLADMIALEAEIERNLEALIPAVSSHAGVADLFTGFRAMTRSQRQALEARLKTISEGIPVSKGTAQLLPPGGLSPDADYPVSTALRIAYTMFQEAVIGYAALHPLATRFLDSHRIAPEGTAYHLTHQHAENYIHAIQQISNIIPDVVLWELDGEGSECQCTCPSCEAGICLCAHAGRDFISSAWAEARGDAGDEAVLVPLPKQNSPAARAGLRNGDLILGANGSEFESFWDIFTVLKDTPAGEQIRWMVRRDSEDLQEIEMSRSD